MKVSELISNLSKYNPDAEVSIVINNTNKDFTFSYDDDEGVTPQTCSSVSICVDKISSMDMATYNQSTVEFIWAEMYDWFGLKLTAKQVIEFLTKHPSAVDFDTVERSLFINEISKKVTGMEYPLNGDTQEYKDKFHTKFIENASQHGIIHDWTVK